MTPREKPKSAPTSGEPEKSEDELDRWSRQLRRLLRPGSYGVVRLEIQDGRVHRLYYERSVKRPDEGLDPDE